MATTTTRGEPRMAAVASWAVLAASFGLSASTWIALAVLAGFSGTVTVAGTVTLSLAWLMPVAMDGYIVVALVLWMAPVPAAVARFAKRNTYTAALVGVAAQSAYHALTVMAATGVLWRCILAAVVGALPPGVAALAVHMRALLRRESRPGAAGSAPAGQAAAAVDPKVAEVCELVKSQARGARTRVVLPPAVTLGHLGAGRPPVHAVAAKPAATPAVGVPFLTAASWPPVGREVAAPVAVGPAKTPASSVATSPATERPSGGRGMAAPVAVDPASFPATTPASSAATEKPAGGRGMAAAVAADVADPPADKPARPRPVGRKEVAARVARIAARTPDVTAVEVAVKVGIPERTARRHLAQAREQMEASAPTAHPTRPVTVPDTEPAREDS